MIEEGVEGVLSMFVGDDIGALADVFGSDDAVSCPYSYVG